MIKVDISNVWGQLSLPDLLATEKEVFDAHMTLTEGSGEGNDFLGWLNLPVTEETDETITGPKETTSDEKLDIEGSVKQEPETEEPRPVNDFLGCRETAVREERVSVQFLFFGAGGDTPVVCIKGGGVLSLEVIHREDGMSLCTFRGLDGEGSYCFWVYTERGWISVRYEKGRFCGFA